MTNLPSLLPEGSFQWHGRDLRLMKRPLFPPMMHLITCPGIGNLGRGQASLPLDALQLAGLPSALSTLAEDAVRVRGEILWNRGLPPACSLLSHSCLDEGLPVEANFSSLCNPQAATDSPFLEGKVSCCTAALCVLLLPASLGNPEWLHGRAPTLSDNQREYALRSAIQVRVCTPT